MFEHDAESILSAEQADAKDALRAYVYEALYEREYKYASKSSGRPGVSGDVDLPFGEEEEDVPVPIDPFEKSHGKKPIKPYFEPTKLDPDSSLPFGSALDAPLR